MVRFSRGKNAYLWARPPRVVALGPEMAEFIRRQTPERAFAALERAASPRALHKRTRK